MSLPHICLGHPGAQSPQQPGHWGRGLLLASSLRQAAASRPVTDDKGMKPGRATEGTHDVDLDNSSLPCLLVTVLTQEEGDSKARDGGASASAWAQPFPTQMQPRSLSLHSYGAFI